MSRIPNIFWWPLASAAGLLILTGCSTTAGTTVSAHAREEEIADSLTHSLASGLPSSYSSDPEYLPPRPPVMFYHDPGHPHHHGRVR